MGLCRIEEDGSETTLAAMICKPGAQIVVPRSGNLHAYIHTSLLDNNLRRFLPRPQPLLSEVPARRIWLLFGNVQGEFPPRCDEG